MATAVYVDGFNLYYGALRAPGRKWLDLNEFCRKLLPKNDVQLIRYFTAKVNGATDAGAPQRQDVYLRALRTISHLEIHLGQFTTRNVWMPLANPPTSGPRKACVVKTEEKGTDVNLASHLLNDAFQGRFDTAVIISNDSDLAEPVTLARYELGRTVGVINPHPVNRKSVRLSQDASFFKQIRAGVVESSQFPNPMSDATGRFTKPSSW